MKTTTINQIARINRKLAKCGEKLFTSRGAADAQGMRYYARNFTAPYHVVTVYPYLPIPKDWKMGNGCISIVNGEAVCRKRSVLVSSHSNLDQLEKQLSAVN
jgi:hypothetical protein